MGRVVKVHSKTIDVQPTLARKVRGVTRVLPVFREVPPLFMQGGAHYEAHPIAVGDSCLLIVCERCFDAWYSGQNEVLPPEDRMFDYSDCVAIVGVNPLASAVPIPSVTTRRGNNDIEGDYVHAGDYDLTGNIDHLGNTDQTGNLTLTGLLSIINTTGNPSTGNGIINWTGNIVINSISVGGHVHRSNGDGNLTDAME